MGLPLASIRVVDLTRFRSGPTAVRQLSDMGAQVIQVVAPSEGRGGASAFGVHGFDYQNVQRNKRSLRLNLRDARGRDVLLRLARRADVLVENFRPGVTARLGIDYETLRAENPRLIYGSISGFGQEGPYRDRPGYDQVAQGMGGLMSITGAPGGGPMRVGIPVADLTAGIFLAQGILVALIERERSGEGQWVTTSLLQAMVNMLDFQATRWLIGGEVPPQAGNDHPTTMPTGVFQCADGQINIAATTPAQWRGLCTTIGAEELAVGPALRGAGGAIGAAGGAARGDRSAHGEVRVRGADRGAQRGRRAVGADPGRAGRVRGPAGAVAADHGAGGAPGAGGAGGAGTAGAAVADAGVGAQRRAGPGVGQRRDPGGVGLHGGGDRGAAGVGASCRGMGRRTR